MWLRQREVLPQVQPCKIVEVGWQQLSAYSGWSTYPKHFVQFSDRQRCCNTTAITNDTRHDRITISGDFRASLELLQRVDKSPFEVQIQVHLERGMNSVMMHCNIQVLLLLPNAGEIEKGLPCKETLCSQAVAAATLRPGVWCIDG